MNVHYIIKGGVAFVRTDRVSEDIPGNARAACPVLDVDDFDKTDLMPVGCAADSRSNGHARDFDAWYDDLEPEDFGIKMDSDWDCWYDGNLDNSWKRKTRARKQWARHSHRLPMHLDHGASDRHQGKAPVSWEDPNSRQKDGDWYFDELEQLVAETSRDEREDRLWRMHQAELDAFDDMLETAHQEWLHELSQSGFGPKLCACNACASSRLVRFDLEDDYADHDEWGLGLDDSWDDYHDDFYWGEDDHLMWEADEHDPDDWYYDNMVVCHECRHIHEGPPCATIDQVSLRSVHNIACDELIAEIELDPHLDQDALHFRRIRYKWDDTSWKRNPLESWKNVKTRRQWGRHPHRLAA